MSAIVLGVLVLLALVLLVAGGALAVVLVVVGRRSVAQAGWRSAPPWTDDDEISAREHR